MHMTHPPINPLKRRNENSMREDDFFGLFNGDPSKRKHSNNEENYYIWNKSLEYLPSFHMEANDLSINQKGANDLFFKEYYLLQDSNKINYKIEEFLEISSSDKKTEEDSFVKDFPHSEEHFSDMYLYWELEEEDLSFVQEIFSVKGKREKKQSNLNKKPRAKAKNTSKKKETAKKTADTANKWLENINIQISEQNVRCFLMGQILKIFSQDQPQFKT